jgi:lycopene beta-cyclase
MAKHWDIVIVGGGLSGLALAAELAAPEFAQLSVLVLEKRLEYLRDRTWSYWAPVAGTQHRYSHLERARWRQWSVALDSQTCVHASNMHTYATLDADAFYAAASQTIAAAPHVQLRLGTGVASMHALDQGRGEPKGVCVTTDEGEAIQARWVFDARPPQRVAPSTLVQQFAGWEVHTEHDAFDASTVQLMAFEPHAKGLHFWYVLPYSARSALVESTWISPASWQPDTTRELQQYLAQRLQGGPYSVAYREQGVLALEAAQQAPAPLAVALGRGGGTLRPSTGYAFLDTLAHAKGLADSLRLALARGDMASVRTNWQAQAFKRPTSDHWMDGVFLNALSQDWLRAPQYFMQMFERVGADGVVAFLAGHASVAQRLAIMRALPVAPFASAALRQVWA